MLRRIQGQDKEGLGMHFWSRSQESSFTMAISTRALTSTGTGWPSPAGSHRGGWQTGPLADKTRRWHHSLLCPRPQCWCSGWQACPVLLLPLVLVREPVELELAAEVVAGVVPEGGGHSQLAAQTASGVISSGVLPVGLRVHADPSRDLLPVHPPGQLHVVGVEARGQAHECGLLGPGDLCFRGFEHSHLGRVHLAQIDYDCELGGWAEIVLMWGQRKSPALRVKL